MSLIKKPAVTGVRRHAFEKKHSAMKFEFDLYKHSSWGMQLHISIPPGILKKGEQGIIELGRPGQKKLPAIIEGLLNIHPVKKMTIKGRRTIYLIKPANENWTEESIKEIRKFVQPYIDAYNQRRFKK